MKKLCNNNKMLKIKTQNKIKTEKKKKIQGG